MVDPWYVVVHFIPPNYLNALNDANKFLGGLGNENIINIIINFYY